MNREPLSAFVVAFNEEEEIAECLRSLAFADEIIVVDSYSTDRTVEIARAEGARIVQHPWSGYIAQKSFALSLVTHEWVLNLDADERVSDELRMEIEAVLRDPAQRLTRDGRPIVGYWMNRVVFYLGRWWRRGGWYPEYRLRLFQKSRVSWGGVEPHEKPIISGVTERLQGEILHYTYRNMNEQFDRLHRYSSISAQEEFKAGRRTNLVSVLISPVVRVLKFYLVKRGYREGMAGLIVALIEGYYTFMKYAKLWELQFQNSRTAERPPDAAR